jgi:hypothetical protein
VDGDARPGALVRRRQEGPRHPHADVATCGGRVADDPGRVIPMLHNDDTRHRPGEEDQEYARLRLGKHGLRRAERQADSLYGDRPRRWKDPMNLRKALVGRAQVDADKARAVRRVVWRRVK